jgi:mRNA interferase HigB
MRVLARGPLRDFAAKHPDADGPLSDWWRIMTKRNYADSHELKRDFATASFLGDGRTVFNIGGGKYRLLVHIRYDWGKVFVLDVLTHDEYDRRGTL